MFDRLKRLCWVLTLVFGGLSSAPVQARTAPEPEVLDADDGTISTPLPLELVTIVEDGEDVVLAAQKLRTTIQEAPSIITVIPRSQLLRRGYRSINDVLRGISGFEGDRWEGNGWQREAFARGLPRTVLVLVNGVNIVEPIRNFVSLDRKIPIEIVERVEVTSGPGGVLWGSNALLGVVNIVTRRVDGRGLQAVAGFGDGPADRVQFKTALGVDYRFNDLVGLFAHLNFYSTAGPELRVHQQKVFGSLPEPAQDGPTLYIPTAATFSPIQRSWYLNFSGRLEIGAFALDWMLPFEDEWRALGFGGAPLTTTYLEGNSIGIGSRGGDSVWVFGASYSDRYSAGDIGLKARAYFVRWQIREDPFGIFPSSPVSLALLGHDRPLVIGLSADLVARTGVSLDVDFQLSNTLTLLTGLESFVDLNHGVVQRSWAADQDGVCPEDFVYDSTDPHLRCHVDDPQVNDVERLSGGAFVHADWKPFSRLGLSAGARVQISDRYDPALLFSGGLVWNFWQEFHLKLFISSGLRPPGTLSTDGVEPRSGVSFDANPDLNVETSTSYETEINARLLRDVGPIRDLFIRANGAYTLMNDVINRPGGVFQNSGARDLWSLEVALRLRFQDGHQIWGNYSFVRAFDDDFEGGELRNFARHQGNIGASLAFFDEQLELTAMLNLKGEMEDPNRPAMTDAEGSDYSASCASLVTMALPTDHPTYGLQQACLAAGMSEAIWVSPGTRIVETIRPVALLDLGVRFKNIWRDLTVSVFVHNVFDVRYYEPDFFGDPRVISRPQPKPGLSIFAQLSLGI